jgi:hypothetical protein
MVCEASNHKGMAVLTIRTIFDHIPKTAGTSVKEAMAAAVGERGELAEEGCYPHHTAVARAGQHRFLASHFWFYAGETLAADWYYSTLLRDPLDRFFSQYYFHRQLCEQVTQGMIIDPVVIAAVHQEMEVYLQNNRPDVKRSYTNSQAFHFASRVCHKPDELDDRQLLDAAIASIEEYDLVGVYTDMQGFIDLYCRDLNLPQQALPQLNVTRHRKTPQDFPPAIIEKLRACNAVDNALYGWAKARFEQHRDKGIIVSTLRRRDTSDIDDALNFGSRDIEILSTTFLGKDGAGSPVAQNDTVEVRFACRATVAEPDLNVGIAVRDSQGNNVCATNSRILGEPIVVSGAQLFSLSVLFDACLAAGDYQVTIVMCKGFSHLEGCYHWLENAVQFSVFGEETSATKDLTIRIAKLP